MSLNKKGISPLIATVLLIGFTIALAVLVMSWGQMLFKQTTEQTEKIATAQIKCVQEVEIKIVDVTSSAGTLTIRVDNKNEATIKNFIKKVYFDNDDIQTIQPTATEADIDLEAYSRKTFTVSYTLSTGATKVKMLELLPIIITEDGETITCAERFDKFAL